MRTFRLIAVVLAVAAFPRRSPAQPAPAGVVTSIVGQVTVARTATPAPVALKFDDSRVPPRPHRERPVSVARVLVSRRT